MFQYMFKSRDQKLLFLENSAGPIEVRPKLTQDKKDTDVKA